MRAAKWQTTDDVVAMLMAVRRRATVRRLRLFALACCESVSPPAEIQSLTTDRLPILADALEEAGCDNAEFLNHCRGPGPHVFGCWALDLVRGCY